jgi:1,4-alpha-glucan branching enzyme
MIKTTKKPKNAATHLTSNAEPIKSMPAKPVSVKPEPTKAPMATYKAPPSANRISLELVKPGAKHVFVAGSFNGWKPESTPLIERGNGRWVGDLSVKPGRHEYLFVVDGQWLPDPNAKETVQNPFGGKNSVLIVSE